MKIQRLQMSRYEIPLTTSQMRAGAFIGLTDELGAVGWGEIAPLPKWSQETLEEALDQVQKKQQAILNIDWTVQTCFQELAHLQLFPAVSFGLESALLSLLAPLPRYSIPISALLMGSPEEILKQAKLRQQEGYTFAKLKVGNLNFKEATRLIHQLKDQFRLRIDVNQAWSTSDALEFFAKFPLDTFDYVEEPFNNPHDLVHFPHPLAVDESFPLDLSLKQLEQLPTLKALIYKPTIQGGMLGCLELQNWSSQRGVSLVLSSSFESDLGLAHIASIAHRLSLLVPIGIGTYHFLNEHLCTPPLKLFPPLVSIPSQVYPTIHTTDKSFNLY